MDMKVGNFYKSIKDNSIIEVLKIHSGNVLKGVDCKIHCKGSWDIKLNTSTKYISPDYLAEYKPINGYNTKLWKVMNEI